MKVLREAAEIVKRHWPRGRIRKGWFIVGLVVVGILVVVGLFSYLLAQLIKSITAGGFRNRELYIPRAGVRR